MYKTFAWYICVLHVEEMLEMLLCKIYGGRNCVQYVGAACCYARGFHGITSTLSNHSLLFIALPDDGPMRSETCRS